MPTKKDVKELAICLHEAYLACPGTEGISEWLKLEKKYKDFYLFVARVILLNPPLSIQKAVRKAEGLKTG